MPAEVESLMYAREVPWHGFGQKVDGLQTAEEAIVAAGLDWEVGHRPLFYRDPTNPKGTVKKISDRVATVRMTDGKYLGITSPGYHIFQNRTAFDFADAIVESGEAKYETAGSLREGKVVFLSMEIPKTVSVDGENEDMRPYLLVANSHDGSRALSARITTVRVVCMNTLNMALGNRNNEIKLRHTRNAEEKVAEAQRALGLTFEYLDRFEAIGRKMLLTKIDERDVLRTMLQVFPIKDVNPLLLNADEIRKVLSNQATTPAAKAMSMYERSDNLANVRGTRWGVFNGIAEYLDFGQFYRSRGVPAADNRATSILLGGPAAQKKEKAAAILSAGLN